ncbi:MAG: ABC transporter substrate-binding protein [Alphaproteobacteria bacterium]|nr:ABC transporter substrate-binding protein [Alphaproteobacteria bacterium]
MRTSTLTLGVITLAIGMAAAVPVMAQDTIKIGVTSGFTGPAAFYGKHQRWGVELAVAEINAKGGVLGKKIELVFEDNRCNPAEAVKAVNALVNDHKVVSILGALCSSATLAALPVVKRAEVPLITSSSTAASITDQIGDKVNRWGFRSTIGDDGMAYAMVAHLKKEGVKKVGIVGEDNDYGRGGAEIFAKALKAAGMEVTSTDFVNPTSPDFTAILTKLKATKPDRIAAYFTSTPLTAFFRQYEAARVGIPGTGRLLLDVIVKAVTPEFVAAGGLDGSTSTNPYSPEIDTPANKAFVEKFKKHAGEEPNQPSFMIYEAMYTLAQAIAKAGTPTPAAIRDALRQVSYPSIMGKTIGFDESHQVKNNAVVNAVKGGKIIVLGMAEG